MTPAPKPRLSLAHILFLALLLTDCLLLLLAIRSADSLRSFAFFHLGVIGLLLSPLTALYYLSRRSLDSPIDLRPVGLILALLLLLSLLLDLSATSLIRDVLGIIHRRFHQPYWQAILLALAAAIYLPLILKSLRLCITQKRGTDLAVSLALLLMLCLLYLPFGFDSIGIWESWVYRTHIDRHFTWSVPFELTTRFSVIVPSLFATLISPDAFHGFHLTHLALIWGKLLLFYGILRKLGVPQLYAFMAALIAQAYPAPADVASLRSLANQFSMTTFLAAVYLMLLYRKHPSRLHLLGAWLGLIFCVTTNESAYALILVAPIIWLISKQSSLWRKCNLTALWCLFPLCHIAHLLLLVSLKFSFYGGASFNAAPDPARTSAIARAAELLANLFRHLFFEGWREALSALNGSDWLPASLILLTIAFILTTRLARCDEPALTTQQAAKGTLAGIFFVIPAVAAIAWLKTTHLDWRLYFFAPFGASFALVYGFALVAAPLKGDAPRKLTASALCLSLFFLGVNQLYAHKADIERESNERARLLRDLLSLAPRIHHDTIILLASDIDFNEVREYSFWPLAAQIDLDDSILSVLYGPARQIQSVYCQIGRNCRSFGDDQFILKSAPLSDLFQRALAFKLNRDLSVQLIDNPIAYLNLDITTPYDISQLYDPDAPLPPRAQSMLPPATQR